MVSDAKRKANAKYDRENTIQKKLKLNKITDADVIAWLNKKDNINGYLKNLIREDRKMTKKMLEELRESYIEKELDAEIELTKIVWVGDVLENCIGDVRPITVEGVETFLEDGKQVARFTFEVEVNEVKCSAEPTLEEINNALDGDWMEFAEYTSAIEF